MPATSTVSPTGTPMIDGVLSGTKWAVSNFTFSFPTSGTYYPAVIGGKYGSGEHLQGFEAFNSAQQIAVRSILGQYAAVANVTFKEISESTTQHADIRFAESSG